MSCEIIRLREKADKFNRLRIQSAQVLMNEDELNVFQSLPLLLHFNMPSLPGYINADVPTGISQFNLTENHHNLISYYFNTDLPDTPSQCDILGLYAMGSTSSIGQCSESDLDIWICYPHQLDSVRVKLLEDKSWLITHWAESLGIELNFFLIPDNKFRCINDAGMSIDGCGSSQHMLLLDEFYRTALLVAGRPILWRLIPIEHEPNYDQYVQSLYDNNKLNKDDWLDLGGFHRIPAEEYFGATLWQLYKGIDNPYKAVLKTILMEAYSWEYPNTELIAITYKKRFQSQEYYDEQLDPYCLMLEKVTAYLTEIKDFKRLEVVRACFYLKTEETLSKICYNDNTAWRRTILNKFVNQWTWTDEQISDLDNRKNWKVNDVTKAKDILLEALMTSYRKLLTFARDNNIGESISAEDIGILSRKLYAAHETLPGKVDLINPNISPDLSEPNLSFIQVPEGRKNPPGWYLYNCSLDAHTLINTPKLMYAKYISKLISWCHMNGLYEEETKLHLYNQGSDLVDKKLNQFIQDLYSVFPVYVPKANNQALSQPCEIKHLTIFLNVEKDPTRHWQDAHENTDSENDNVLSYGQNNECLIGSIDLIYRNSWNEVRTLHFNNSYAVVDALNTILGKMHQDALPPDQIDLFCYSQHFREQISQSFRSKLEEYIQLRLDSVSQRSVQTLWTGGRKFGFYFERTGVSLQHLQSTVDIYSHISNKKLSNSVINLKNTFFDKTAKVIESHISEGLIQFFFENYPDGFNVYIANAENEVESFQSFAGSKDDLVQNVNRFYASNNNQKDTTEGQINFNLPQFYEIELGDNDELELTSFKSKCKNTERTLI
ncbi:class I adenylate cyclase [Psychromonas sp. psych-6C06]|uniref:class I adenylate cyclase n=1 Tax=Psychromonas sp. psych-6C06 TaxID=2058089 RepID=UPI000C33F85C|nr:class I adenylate cyclase [Psychromonas sp. psych-6C06]PKF60526.1 class I adenylate cyclase [Psychromonas sp. psych-6C06]